MKMSDTCYFCGKEIGHDEALANEIVLLTCPDGVMHHCHKSHHGVVEEAIKQANK